MRRQFGATVATPVSRNKRIRARFLTAVMVLVPLALIFLGGLIPVPVVNLILTIVGYVLSLLVAVYMVWLMLTKSTTPGGQLAGLRYIDTRTGEPTGVMLLVRYLVQGAFESCTLGLGLIFSYMSFQDGQHWFDRAFNMVAVPAEPEALGVPGLGQLPGQAALQQAAQQPGQAQPPLAPRPYAPPAGGSSPQNVGYAPQYGNPQVQPVPVVPQSAPTPPPFLNAPATTPSPGFRAPSPAGYAAIPPAPPEPQHQNAPTTVPRVQAPAPQPSPFPESPQSSSPAPVAMPEPAAAPQTSPAPQPSPFIPQSGHQPLIFRGAAPTASPAPVVPAAPVYPSVVPARGTVDSPTEALVINPAPAARAADEPAGVMDDETVVDLGADAVAIPARHVVLDDGLTLTVDGPMVLGRNPVVPRDFADARCVQVMDESMRMSKTHLVLYADPEGVMVVDLGSTNGVYVEVDGERRRLTAREPRLLGVGEHIHFGGRTLGLAP